MCAVASSEGERGLGNRILDRAELCQPRRRPNVVFAANDGSASARDQRP